MPLLEHPGLGPLAGGAVDRGRVVLIGPGGMLGGGLLRAHVVARGEERADPTEDDHSHPIVLLGPVEGLVELDQQAAVLGVAGPGAVEHDPHHRAVIEFLVGDVLAVLCGFRHDLCPSSSALPRLGPAVPPRGAPGGPATLYLEPGRNARLGRAHRAAGGASASRSGPSRSATSAARLNFMASLRGMPVTNSTVLGTL